MIRLTLVVCLAFGMFGCGEFHPPVAETTAGMPPAAKAATELRAGVAKVEITNLRALPFSDSLYVKALVLKKGDTTTVLITLDAVAVGEIGPIRNDYLGKVRA